MINSFKVLENWSPPLFDISDWDDRRNKKLRKLYMTKVADKILIHFFKSWSGVTACLCGTVAYNGFNIHLRTLNE
jgi:hypothetical protein